MENFFVKRTVNTPEINFIASEGEFGIEGRAIPEDPGAFFEEVIRRLNEYYKNPQPLTKLNIKLEYVNSGSVKILLKILRMVKKHYEMGHDCIVTWYFEEEDDAIKELGAHFESTIKVPFRLIGYY